MRGELGGEGGEDGVGVKVFDFFLHFEGSEDLEGREVREGKL